MKQAYPGRAIEMVYTSKTIADNLSANLDELSEIRSGWTPDYVADLKQRIDYILENRMGLDKNKDLRMVSNHIEDIEAPALHDLAVLRKQLKVDFSGDRLDEILNTLGYSKHLVKARKRDTESVFLLLNAFRLGMTEELKEQIVAKGTSPKLIDRIIGYSGKLSEANAKQESLKVKTMSLTSETQEMLNNLYYEIIGICKIAYSFYRNDPVKRAQFTFRKIWKRLRNRISNSSDEPETSQE